jgi:integrase
MAYREDMTWVKGRGIWKKVYRGKAYYISYGQLKEAGYSPAEDSRDGTRHQANTWWAKKQADLEKANQPPAERSLTPAERAAMAFSTILQDRWADFLSRLDSAGKTEEFVKQELLFLMEQFLLNGQPLPDYAAKHLEPARQQQLADAGKALRGEAVAPPEKTVEAHVEAWLKRQRVLVEAGRMSADRHRGNRTGILHFQKFLGPQSDVARIDASRLDAFYLYALGRVRKGGQGEGWSVAYVRDMFAVARNFIRWCWKQDSCELPRNINDRFSFGPVVKQVTTWSPEEFRRAVGAATGALKLALLLMANCGMTQKDVSDLQDSEVDWVGGRIIRRRSKTREKENVPVVNYLLWPTTWELLQAHRSGQETVLLTKAGKPYLRVGLTGKGNRAKLDRLARDFYKLRAKIQMNRPLKELRKLGASLLNTRTEYGRLAPLFLGHAPKGVSERHYLTLPQELFDEAVTWLGQQLGQVQ